MISHALEIVLGRCDAIGVALRLNGDKIAFAFGDEGFPPDLRAALTAVRGELMGVLRLNPRPDPDPVLFASKRLDAAYYGAAAVKACRWVYSGDVPYYRVTPAVLAWVGAAIDRMPRSADPSERIEIGRCFGVLHDYCHAHFRSDQIVRGMLNPSVPKAIPPVDLPSSAPSLAAGTTR